MQYDLFTAAPTPPVVAPPRVMREIREVITRAACGRAIRVYDGDPDPFEVEVRGIPTVIAGGFCTRAIEGPGSAFWSETGFRSFGIPTCDPDEVRICIERYIDKDCGGKLTRWWPGYVTQWRQSLAFELEVTKQGGRESVWAQWGPEKWEDCWHRHDMRLADAVDQMIAEGIDPNDVGPPSSFRGKWPRIDVASIANGAAA